MLVILLILCEYLTKRARLPYGFNALTVKYRLVTDFDLIEQLAR